MGIITPVGGRKREYPIVNLCKGVRLSVHGATTAEKLTGTKVWVPTRGGACAQRSAKGGAGCWVREGVVPPAMIRGYHPQKILENLDVKPCILVTSCCEISCFLKTTAKKLGDQYIVSPPT